MGNLSSTSHSVSNSVQDIDDDELIQVNTPNVSKPAIPLTHYIQHKNHIQSQQPTNLYSLYPYLTHQAPLNDIDIKENVLAFIANIISKYAFLKNEMRQTFQFRVSIKFADISNLSTGCFSNILCGCSWNGIVYLLSPINNKQMNGSIYTIDAGKQRILSEVPSLSTLQIDPNLCCVASHIIGHDKYKKHFDPNVSMVIDGLIFCNAESNIIYGYSMIKGLFQIKQFYAVENEVVISLWRQDLNVFVLTSKFRLFVISINAKQFIVNSICTFYNIDIGDIHEDTDYMDCYYDTKTESLFLIYKDKQSQMVDFKIYESHQNGNNKDSDMTKDYDESDLLGIGSISVEYETPGNETIAENAMDIPNELKVPLNDGYHGNGQSMLVHHKPSDCLLLVFGQHIFQFKIDFVNKTLQTLNMGKVNVVRGNKLDTMIESEEGKQCDVCDMIIGYNELESCFVLDLKECSKKLSSLYNFKIALIRAKDLSSEWKQII